MNKDDDRKRLGTRGLKNIQVETILVSGKFEMFRFVCLRAFRGEIGCIANTRPIVGFCVGIQRNFPTGGAA